MKMTIYIICAAIILVAISFFLSCVGTKPEKEAIVRNKCKEYLKNKYNKEFEILQFKQMFHGGNWRYETDIEAAPVENQLLKFWVRYNAKEKKVSRDDYKKAFWEHQVEEELKPLVSEQFQLLEFDARLSKNGSIVFLSSDLEFYPNYKELAENVELPVLNLTIRIAGFPEGENALDCFIKLSEILSETAFVKNQFSIFFYNKEILGVDSLNFKTNSNQLDKTWCKKQLLFKTTNRTNALKKEDLEFLLVDYKGDSLFKNNGSLFNEAEKARQANDKEKALKLYLTIIKSVSPYRYSTYSPAESSYSVESAFYAAEIYSEKGENEQALKYYNLVVEKLEYEEVRLHLSDFYKIAKQKLEEEEK